MDEFQSTTNDAPVEKSVTRETTATFNQFLAMLEDGALHADLSEALRDINAEMNNHAQAYGRKAKGKMTITIDFLLDKGVFDIQADFKATLPKDKRPRSVAWSTPGNNFTPNNPKQMQLFGVRDVTSANNSEIRKV